MLKEMSWFRNLNGIAKTALKNKPSYTFFTNVLSVELYDLTIYLVNIVFQILRRFEEVVFCNSVQ